MENRIKRMEALLEASGISSPTEPSSTLHPERVPQGKEEPVESTVEAMAAVVLDDQGESRFFGIIYPDQSDHQVNPHDGIHKRTISVHTPGSSDVEQ
jgi:hypothetical protein